MTDTSTEMEGRQMDKKITCKTCQFYHPDKWGMPPNEHVDKKGACSETASPNFYKYKTYEHESCPRWEENVNG